MGEVGVVEGAATVVYVLHAVDGHRVVVASVRELVPSEGHVELRRYGISN